MSASVKLETLREWAMQGAAGERRELRQEIERLTKIIQQQGKESRRLKAAWKRLKDEKRTTHDLLKMCEQLQDEVERLTEKVDYFESDRVAQTIRNLKGTRQALSLRYGHLHNALTGLLNGDVSEAQARQALADVDDKRWVRASLPGATNTQPSTATESPRSESA